MKAKKITSEDIVSIERDSWKVLIGGISVNIILGSFYAWGAYAMYLSSYLKTIDERVSSDRVSLIFPLMNITMNAMIPWGEKIVGKLGIRWVVFIGVAMLSGAFSLLAIAQNFYLVLAVFVLVVGPLYGIMYVVPFLCSWRFFPMKSGEVNATLQAGYGIGAALFSYFAYQIVNSDNDYPRLADAGQGYNRQYFEPYIGFRMQNLFRFFAAAFAILGVFALAQLRSQGNEKLLQYQQLEMIKQRSVKQDQQSKDKQKRMSPQSVCPTLSYGIKSKQFAQLIAFAVTSSFFGYFAIAFYKSNGQQQLKSDLSSTVLGSVSFAFFGSSRYLWTHLINVLEFRKSFYLLIFSQIALIGLFQLFSKESNLVYCASIFALIFIQGGVFSWFSKFVPKVFGYKLANQIFGLILIAFACSNLLMHLVVILTQQNGTLNLDLINSSSIISLVAVAYFYRSFDENPEFV